jgi:hypothetical protein
MRPRLAFALLAILAFLFALVASAAGAPAPAATPAAPAAPQLQTGNAFIHLSTHANVEADSTYLDDLTLNNKASAAVFTMNLRAPYGSAVAAHDMATGVWYDDGPKRWAIFNENLLTMTAPLAWNVLAPPAGSNVFVHVSTITNTSGSQTYIDNPQLNGQPGAQVFIQPVYNPAIPLPLDDLYTHTVSVAYSTPRQQWSILNDDGSAFPAGIGFFVLKAGPDVVAFNHISSSANHFATNGTSLDNPLINGNPDAEILVTQNFGSGVTSRADNHRLDLFYDTGSQRWVIEHSQSSPGPAPMDTGVMFNVLVIPPSTGFLVQTVSETGSYHSQLNAAGLNNDPYARVYVMHNYSAPEAQGPHFNDHPIGVFYSTVDQHWYVYNRDYSPLPHGSAYNVYYTQPRGNSFVASSSALNTSTSYLTLHNPLLDSRPQAQALTTFDLSPNGVGSGVVYTPSTGLLYDATPQAWDVFNQPGPDFPANLSYNVLIPAAHSFVVTATLLNTDDNHLFIDNALTNGDPLALVFATPRHTPPDIDNHNIGVYWDGTGWALFNENPADSFGVGQAFDVFVIKRSRLYLPAVAR